MKKKLSVWLHGGVGTGHFDQGYPMLEYLLSGLAESFEIVVYSQLAPNPGYSHPKFLIRTASDRKSNGLIRWITLLYLFIRDNHKSRYSLMLAFWGWPAGVIVVLLGKILRIRNAVYVLGGDAAGIRSINYGILHSPLKRKIALWTYRNAGLLLGISFYQKDQLSSFGLGRRMVIIPWGAEPSIYKFKLKHRGHILHFIHVGHLTPVKDQTTLIRAFALINKERRSELYIIGVDCLDGAMQDLCEKLGVQHNVKFAGMVPYNKMPSYYEWADIMLHTSLSEGQSMALTEAAACGVLLAGTRVGLLHDLTDECGITVDLGDHENLARKILEILADPDQWQAKIANARKWSRRHTLQWTVNELTKELNNL